MKNVRLFPVKYLPLTISSEEILEKFRDKLDKSDFRYPYCAMILSFMELYGQKPILKILSETLLNKKIKLCDSYIEWDLHNWDDIRFMLGLHCTGVAWEICLKKTCRDKKLSTQYEKIINGIDENPNVGWEGMLPVLWDEIQICYQKFDFFRFGTYWIILSLFKLGLLDNIKGVNQWIRNNTAKWEALLMDARPIRLLRIASPNGGQKTLPNIKKK